MRAATDATAMIDFLAIALSLPNALLNLGKPDSFLRNESSRSGLNLGSVAVLRRVVVGALVAAMNRETGSVRCSFSAESYTCYARLSGADHLVARAPPIPGRFAALWNRHGAEWGS
jgi:hypothetical protein